MSLRSQFAAVGIVAVGAESALGALVLAGDGPSRIAVFLIACAVATALLTAGMWWVLGLPPRSGGEGGGDDGPGTEGPPGSPPPWWPEFERDFRLHVRDRERRRVRSGR